MSLLGLASNSNDPSPFSKLNLLSCFTGEFLYGDFLPSFSFLSKLFIKIAVSRMLLLAHSEGIKPFFTILIFFFPKFLPFGELIFTIFALIKSSFCFLDCLNGLFGVVNLVSLIEDGDY